MGIYDLMMEKVSMLIKADNLASIPEARVNRHRPLLSDRCRQKELLQVLAKHSNRLKVSLLLELVNDLISYGRLQKTLV